MSKTIKRLLFFAVGLLLVLLVAIAFLTVPDQLRQVPEPHYFAAVTENSLPPAVDLDSPAISAPSENLPTELNWPKPDLSHLDSETRQSLEQCRDEILELSKQLMLVPSRTKGMAQVDATTELRRFDRPLVESLNEYFRICGEHGLDAGEFLAVNDRIRREVSSEVYAQQERWLAAGTGRIILVSAYTKNQDTWDGVSDSDWDAATYYFRRGGLKGRASLGLFSVIRRLKQSNESDEEGGEGNPQ